MRMPSDRRERSGYQPFHVARGELLARAGRRPEAADSFRSALAFPINEVERRHIQKRLAGTESP